MTVGIQSREDHVVLLDARGRPNGLADKSSVHGATTPLHFAFSCHVVDGRGRVLLTRRAASKRTWPATWSNACCGHPRYGESLREAVTRRLHEELGLVPSQLALALPDFAYRARMQDGTTEHELCPVIVARVDGDPQPDPAEVDAVSWTTWSEVRRRAATEPDTLSPWATQQIAALASLGTDLCDVLDTPGSHGSGALDEVITSDVVAGDPASRVHLALRPILDPVNVRIEAFLEERTRQLVDLDPAARDIADAVARLVRRGGKRLRPAFVYWGHAATGNAMDPEIVDVAAAVEMLHTFALLHDDVMDRSEMRRSAPAAHVALAGRRPGASPDPHDSEWFGISAAILAGDLAFVWADELFAAGTNTARRGDARAAAGFDRLRSEVITGQYLDLRLAAEPAPSEDAARRVAMLKTARYTVTRPLQIGAALGNGAACLDAVLERYGDAVGLAFQLRDDVLGIFGDQSETGKCRLDDLREGKHTLLVIRALALADPSQRAVLMSALGRPDLDVSLANECRLAIAETGALASVEALIADRFHHARAALAEFPGTVADALLALAEFAAYRRY